MLDKKSYKILKYARDNKFQFRPLPSELLELFNDDAYELMHTVDYLKSEKYFAHIKGSDDNGGELNFYEITPRGRQEVEQYEKDRNERISTKIVSYLTLIGVLVSLGLQIIQYNHDKVGNNSNKNENTNNFVENVHN